MNIKKLKEAVDELKKDMGEGLISTDVFSSADGQSIYGFNSQPKACAFFNQVTDHLIKSLQGSGLPPLGRYYIVDVADDKIIMVIATEEFQWGMIVNTKKIQTGLLLNVILPEIVDKFQDARAG
ncbi:MAG: hypothetical protein JW742_09025 [Candidatus Aminicenantes bacterium]|nr:hypothetical protein [Candidatus Aminicenantes bacterium]